MWKPVKLANGKYALVQEESIFLFWRKRHYLCGYDKCPMQFSDELAARVAINHINNFIMVGYVI